MTRPFQAAKETGRELVRELNAWHATSIVVGTIIGSGIFRVSSEMMRDVGSPGMVYVVWIVGGLLSFFGALTYAELGSLKPSAGGEYVYVRDGYGPLPGFLYAWTWFVIAKPASIAAIATGIVDVLSTFARFSFLQHVFLTLHVTSARSIEISYGALVAIAAAILISAVNYIGVRNAGNFQLVLTAFKVVMIAAVVLIGFTAASGTWSNFGTKFLGAKGGIAGFMAAMIAALWAYDGWNDLNMVSGEIRNPERNIPIALISGVALVAVLYMGMNAAIQYVMPSPAIAGSPVAGSAATQIAVGWWGAALVSAGMALSMLVTMNGTIMSGGRIPYAVARDGYFFKALAEVHPRFHTPSTAIVVQAIMSIALLLVGGAFKELFSLAIFAEWLFYMIAASTIFVFRKREPAAPRAYRTWGYPVVPALFIIAAAGLLYYTLTDPDTSRNSVLGMLVILAGVPVYWFFAKRRKET